MRLEIVEWDSRCESKLLLICGITSFSFAYQLSYDCSRILSDVEILFESNRILLIGKQSGLRATELSDEIYENEKTIKSGRNEQLKT